MARALLLLALLVACGRDASTPPPTHDGHGEPHAPEGDDAPSWETRGTVEAVAEDGSRVTIAHEDVPDYMPAMTMPFFAQGQGQLEGLAAGDAVAFRFTRRPDGKHVLLEIAKR
ncbi:MAG: copper-binding protein [Myxococcota bacterium]